MTETVFERYRREAEAFSNAVYQRWFTEAMFAVAIKLPLQAEITFLVGYNPQKLLPSPERCYADRVLGFIAGQLSIPWQDLMKPFPVISPGTELLFAKGGMIDFIPDVRRWEHPDSDPLGDIKRFREESFKQTVAVVKVSDLDYGDLEARMRALQDDPRVSKIVLDVEMRRDDDFMRIYRGTDLGKTTAYRDDLFNMGLELARFEKPVQTSAGARDQSYLQHDPSKTHKHKKPRKSRVSIRRQRK